MKINELPKITVKRKRRLGRGSGSGRGKTAGRGTKGQKARGKIKLGFEGGQLPLVKRLPLVRGKRRNKPLKPKFLIVNVKYLNLLPVDTTVNLESLIKYGIVREDEARLSGVKILGEGELKKPLKVELPCSKGAGQKIEKAGGVILKKHE